jgi:hypothetical protein
VLFTPVQATHFFEALVCQLQAQAVLTIRYPRVLQSYIFDKINIVWGLSSGLEQEQFAGCCEHRNETSGSIKRGEFF